RGTLPRTSRTLSTRWCPPPGRPRWGGSRRAPRGPPRRPSASSRVSLASTATPHRLGLRPELPNRLHGVRPPVDPRARDEDVPAPLRDLAHVAFVDPTVDLEVQAQAPLGDEGAQVLYLGEHPPVHGLAAEARADGEEEKGAEPVEAFQGPLRELCLRLEGQPHLLPL